MMLLAHRHGAAQARGGEPRVGLPEPSDVRRRIGRYFSDPGSILEFEALTRAGVREDVAASFADIAIPSPLDPVRQDRVELPSVRQVSVTARSSHPHDATENVGSVQNLAGEIRNV